MGSTTLLIRADAEGAMGAGHIMRCIALAQGWQETGGEVFFVISRLSTPFETNLTREGFGVIIIDEKAGSAADAEHTRTLAEQNNAAWIILDGYHFNDDYERRVTGGRQKLLVVDDYGHAKHHTADIVLNQNVYATMALYPNHLKRTRFLLGGTYTLLRREFLRQKPASGLPEPGPVKRILITMGGSDPDNLTSTILETLLPITERSQVLITVVVGMMNRFFPEGSAHYRQDYNIRIIRAPDNMPELIRQADIAITGAGSTVWEMAFLGTPMIAIVLSENQRMVAAALEQAGAAVTISNRTRVSELLGPAISEMMDSAEQRRSMAAKAHRLIDGGGVSRVVMAMQDWKVRLRRVTEEDSDLLLAWANDPVVRNNAFSQDPISHRTHEEWFRRKLQSMDTAIFIALDKDDQPAGQVRFDREGDAAEVDISVAASQRGGGLGVEILRLGIAKLFHTTDIKKINASVKSENIASKKMFEQAGFRCTGTTRTGEAEVVQFAYERG